MKYFKSALGVHAIKEVVESMANNFAVDSCIVEIKNKKSLIVTSDDIAAAGLSVHTDFKEVFLTEPEIISIPVIHNIVSVTGNADLFYHHKDYSGMLS